MARNFKFLSPVVFYLLIITGIIGACYFTRMYSVMHATLQLKQPVTLRLKPGSSIRALAQYLEQKELLSNKNFFILWGRIHDQATRLQAGDYLISNGDTLSGLLQRMVRGKVIQYRITLVEGKTAKQYFTLIRQSPYLHHMLGNLSSDGIMKKLGYGGQHAEGRFFPDTYYVTDGMSDIDLLQQAYRKMQQVLTQEWQQRQKGLPFKSAYQALILASIVEKETALAVERPLIAGVFINRLRKHMRLQTDPSVIYGIKNYDGDIHLRDLRKDTPYNTYTRYGLPPTPIAMPGRKSIHAVLHPATTNMLYFVAYGDGSGRHVFSSNLKDHEKAVNTYQRHRK